MGLESRAHGSESRFAAYVEAITAALGHADRAAPFRSYCAGLLLPGDRKSVEPMAARVQPGRVQAAHQSLHHFVAKADWSDDRMLAAVRAIRVRLGNPFGESAYESGAFAEDCPSLRELRRQLFRRSAIRA